MAEKATIWMPLYPGDYLADTQRLTTEQHGAYLLLIMDYWRCGRPPCDDETLQNITRLRPTAWRKHKSVLLAFFELEDGKLYHKRIEQELAASRERVAANSERAKAGARARWGGRSSGSNSHAPSNARSNAISSRGASLEGSQSSSPSESKSKFESSRTRGREARPIGDLVPDIINSARPLRGRDRS